MDKQKKIILGIFSVLILYQIYFIVKPVFRGELHSHTDIEEQYIPWRIVYKLALDNGELPFWNPTMFRGYPHHGEGQSGVLHPSHYMLYKALPIEHAIMIEELLPLLICLLGALTFFRYSLKFDWLATLCGASLFTFTSFAWVHLLHVNMLWVYAHLPWTLFFIYKVFHGDRKAYWAAMLSLSVVSQILLGHPQMLWLNALSCLGLTLIYFFNEQNEHAKKYIGGLLGIALVASLLMGMIQIIPTYNYLKRSARKSIDQKERSHLSMHPAAMLLHFSPYVFQNKVKNSYHWNGQYIPDNYMEDGQRKFHVTPELANYFGLSLSFVIICLIFFSEKVKQIKRSTKIILGVSAAVSLLLSFGHFTPIIRLIDLLPIVSKFRVPIRYIIILNQIIAVLTAWGLHMLITEKKDALSNKKRALLFIPLIISISFSAAVLFGNDEINWSFISISKGSFMSIMYGPILIAITIAALILSISKSKITTLIVSVIAMLIVADQIYYHILVLKYLRTTEIAGIRKSYESSKAYGIHNYRYFGNNKLTLEGHYLANGYLGLEPERILKFDQKNFKLENIYISSVSHLQLTTGEQIREVPSPIPRVRLIATVKHNALPTDERPIQEQLRESVVDPDLSELTGPPIDKTEYAKIIHDGFTKLVIETNTSSQRLLIVSDRYWPGWKAKVNNQAVDIIPLYNGSMRGIMLPKGKAIIAFNYMPQDFHILCYLFFAGIFAINGLIILQRRLIKKE